MTNIVFFSDKNYEYQIRGLIKSIDLRRLNGIQLIYYTVGFDSEMERPDLIKKRIEFDSTKPRFEFYKPGILLDVARNFPGHSIFLDSDIIVGKRFDPDKIKHDLDFPLFSVGNWEGPFSYYHRDTTVFPAFKIGERVSTKHYTHMGEVIEINHETQTIKFVDSETRETIEAKQIDMEPSVFYDHYTLMSYMGVKDIAMTYVSTCFASFNDKCQDLLLEWKATLENEYLLKKHNEYFAFHDETALNVIMWRRKINQNLGRVFLNTLYSSAAIETEINDNIENVNIQDNPNQYCSRSSDILFYHGMKDQNEIEKILEHLSRS